MRRGHWPCCFLLENLCSELDFCSSLPFQANKQRPLLIEGQLMMTTKLRNCSWYGVFGNWFLGSFNVHPTAEFVANTQKILKLALGRLFGGGRCGVKARISWEVHAGKSLKLAFTWSRFSKRPAQEKTCIPKWIWSLPVSIWLSPGYLPCVPLMYLLACPSRPNPPTNEIHDQIAARNDETKKIKIYLKFSNFV